MKLGRADILCQSSGLHILFLLTELHGAYSVSMPELEQFIEFLQHLSDMGAAMKAIITRAMLDTIIYEKLQSMWIK